VGDVNAVRMKEWVRWSEVERVVGDALQQGERGTMSCLLLHFYMMLIRVGIRGKVIHELAIQICRFMP